MRSQATYPKAGCLRTLIPEPMLAWRLAVRRLTMNVSPSMSQAAVSRRLGSHDPYGYARSGDTSW